MAVGTGDAVATAVADAVADALGIAGAVAVADAAVAVAVIGGVRVTVAVSVAVGVGDAARLANTEVRSARAHWRWAVDPSYASSQPIVAGSNSSTSSSSKPTPPAIPLPSNDTRRWPLSRRCAASRSSASGTPAADPSKKSANVARFHRTRSSSSTVIVPAAAGSATLVSNERTRSNPIRVTASVPTPAGRPLAAASKARVTLEPLRRTTSPGRVARPSKATGTSKARS